MINEKVLKMEEEDNFDKIRLKSLGALHSLLQRRFYANDISVKKILVIFSISAFVLWKS